MGFRLGNLLALGFLGVLLTDGFLKDFVPLVGSFTVGFFTIGFFTFGFFTFDSLLVTLEGFLIRSIISINEYGNGFYLIWARMLLSVDATKRPISDKRIFRPIDFFFGTSG